MGNQISSNGKFNSKIISIICVALLLVIIITFLLTKNIRLEHNFKKLGEDFYTNYYYDKTVKDMGTKEVKKFFTNVELIGIKVSLSNLEKYCSKGNEKIIKKLKASKCDESKSVIIIYPKKPFDKKDYKIEAKLSCNK